MSRVIGLAVSGGYLIAMKERGIHAYRSADHGRTWTRADQGLEQPNLRAMISAGPALLATSGGGIYRSDDHGGTWNRAGSLARADGLAADGDAVYARADSSVYRSPDTGRTWTAAVNGIGHERVLRLYAHAGRVYAYLMNENLYMSPDQGNTWTSQGRHPVNFFGAQGGALLRVSDGLYRSLDHGATWTRTHPLPPGYRGIRCLMPMGPRLFAGFDGPGVFRASDADSTWVARNSGLIASDPWELASIGGRIFAGGTWTRLHGSVDAGHPETPSTRWSRGIPISTLPPSTGSSVRGTRGTAGSR